jgi:hypothetical protein
MVRDGDEPMDLFALVLGLSLAQCQATPCDCTGPSCSSPRHALTSGQAIHAEAKVSFTWLTRKLTRVKFLIIPPSACHTPLGYKLARFLTCESAVQA